MDLFELVCLAFAVGFPFVLVGVVLAFIMRQNKREKALGKALSLQGTSVTGQILKHRVEEVGRGCRCYLTYQYVFEGTNYEYEQLVKLEGFNSVKDGEAVKILVLPQDPSTPRLAPMSQFQFLW